MRALDETTQGVSSENGAVIVQRLPITVWIPSAMDAPLPETLADGPGDRTVWRGGYGGLAETQRYVDPTFVQV